MESEVRTCTKCGVEQPRSEFYKGRGAGGLTSHCKACYREWHRKRYSPKNGETDAPRPCEVCGEIFTPTQRRRSLYCSKSCKNRSKSFTGRDAYLQRKFGIDQVEYDRMLAEQGGGCAICGKTAEQQTREGFRRWLHIDHCHDTGRIRGLLCDRHNLLLGHWNHDPALLRKAADYLEG